MSEKTELETTSVVAAAPVLTRRWLIILLALMSCVAVITILTLWTILPKVYEQELEASIRLEGNPSADYYELEINERTPVSKAILVLKNESDETWTNPYIRINGSYMAFEKNTSIDPGQEHVFELGRFQTRRAAFLDLRFSPIRKILVYARLPSGARATYEIKYPIKNP